MEEDNKKGFEENKEYTGETNNKHQKNNKMFIYVVISLLVIISFVLGFFANKMLESDKKESNNIDNKENNNEINENKEENIIETNDNNEDNKLEKDGNNEEVNDEDVSKLLDTETLNELEEIRNYLNNKVTNDSYIAYKVSCQVFEDREYPFEDTYIKISNQSINTVIDKLKTAVKVNKNVVEGIIGCPPKNVLYKITNTEQVTSEDGKIFIMWYDGSTPSVVVGYSERESGYRFFFEKQSDLDNFIENLS